MAAFGDNLSLDRRSDICVGNSTDVPVGYPNRYFVVIYQVWVLVVAGFAWQLINKTKERTKE